MTALYLHEDVKELLAGKTLVVIGDSVERSVYKDLVCLLQENRYLTDAELRKKGEASFIGDELLYGGVKGEMKNTTSYRECRYYKADNEACCRYYFVTICYGDYVEEVLQELSLYNTDIVVMNSCLWDVHRHGKRGIDKYEENLEKLVASLRRLLPDCLFIWLTTPPVDIKSKGGFLMRPGNDDVKIQEVKYCNEIARDVFLAANEIDRRFRIVDLDYVFRHFVHHRANDGVHWNERAHRRMSNMILEECSKAFNKSVPRVLGVKDKWNSWNGHEQNNFFEQQPGHYNQWDDNEPDFWGRRDPPFQENGWDFDENNMPLPSARGYPFGPPNMPGPAPYGPPDHMRASFMEDPRGIMPFVNDLDDLGQARQQVESQMESRKRKHVEDADSSVAPEKQYRFGVASASNASNALKRKAADQNDEQAKKVTIVEVDGVMKKLVTLKDGVTLYSAMTEKEVKAHVKEQADKAGREKRLKEKKEREEKEKIKREEERKKKEEEAKKKKDEAKLKKEISDEKAAKLKESVSKLPLVSSVPKPDDEEEKETEEKKPAGRLSKFASKLLSFIKKPPSDKSSEVLPKLLPLKSLPDEKPHLINAYRVQPLRILAAKILSCDDKPTTPTFDNVINPFQIPDDEKKKLVPLYKSQSFFSNIVKRDVTPPKKDSNHSVSQNSSVEAKSTTTTVGLTIVNSIITTTVATLRTEPVKKVDTLALLSMQSPFAKPKVAPCAVTSKVSSTIKPKEELATRHLVFAVSINDLPLLDNGSPKYNPTKEEDMEESLLNDADINDTLSDVDESILDDNFNSFSTESNKKVPVVPVCSATTPNKPTGRVAAKPTSISTKKQRKLVATPETPSSIKKKKKKKMRENETKEERALRKKLKKDKKLIKEQNKMNRIPSTQQLFQQQQQEEYGHHNNHWNMPIQKNSNGNRERSATWAPSYYPSYENHAKRQTQQQPPQQQPQMQPPQQHPPQQETPQPIPKVEKPVTPAAQVVINPYQRALQTQLLQQQQQHQQQQQIIQQQYLARQQQQQQQQAMLQQQALLQQQQLQQQKTQQQQQQQQQAAVNKSSTQSKQLYIDEYGQTYTLEEETYIVGPSGEIQNITSGTSSYMQQQTVQQQQQSAQQQYIQSSLLYQQQQQQTNRFL